MQLVQEIDFETCNGNSEIDIFAGVVYLSDYSRIEFTHFYQGNAEYIYCVVIGRQVLVPVAVVELVDQPPLQTLSLV